MPGYHNGKIGGINTHIEMIRDYVEKNIPDVRIFPIDIRRDKYRPLAIASDLFRLPRIVYSAAYKLLFSRADIIHVHHSVHGVRVARSVRRNVPVVFTIHNSPFPELVSCRYRGTQFYVRVFYKAWYREMIGVLRDVDFVISVSKWIADGLRQRYGVNALHIPNMVDLSDITPASEDVLRSYGINLPENYVVWLGARIDHPGYKRPCDFVELARAVPDVNFVMPGRLDRVSLERLCGPLPDNLLIIPAASYDFRRDVFLSIVQHADVAVLTSYYEAFGYVILEALALGVPVLVPDTGGPPEIVSSPRVGSIYRTGDVHSAAKELSNMLSHLDRYDSEFLRAHVAENFGADVIVPKILDVYSELL